MGDIKIIKTSQYPICPYCEKELTSILKNTEFENLFTTLHTMYFCPHCKKLLRICND